MVLLFKTGSHNRNTPITLLPKILIVRFSSIGDVVLTTPVIRCVKLQLGAEVHFLTKAKFAAVLAENPYLDRLWTIEKSLAEIGPALRREGFTHVVDLHRNLRTARLKALLTIPALHLRPRPLSRPRFLSFQKLNWQKFLFTRFKINRLPDVHIVDRYLATVAPLGVKNDGRGLDYFVAKDKEVDPGEHQLPTDYLAFVIGAAHATKRLTEQQIQEFCAGLKHPVILLGGPAEKELGERVATGLANVHNACGKFSLAGSASLIQRARAVLTHDTGMMHVAAAYRKPIISIWGNTTPAFGMYPYLPETQDLERSRRLEVRNLGCRPCSKIGHDRCPKGHFRCMLDQDLDAARARVQGVLTEQSSPT